MPRAEALAEAPVADPEAPVAEPEAPVADPEAPVAEPEAPAPAPETGSRFSTSKSTGPAVRAPVSPGTPWPSALPAQTPMV